MNPLNFPLLVLTNNPDSFKFTPIRQPFSINYPIRDRMAHGTKLQRQFEEIWNQNLASQSERRAQILPYRSGLFIEFASQPGFPIKLKSLENLNSGIKLVNARTIEKKGKPQLLATVYIPSNQRNFFLKKFKQFTNENTRNQKPKHNELVAGIEDLQLAILESFWMDPPELMPMEKPKWCEAWLYSEIAKEDDELLNTFFSLCTILGINYKPQKITFPERTVTLVYCNRNQLTELIEACDFVAEFRIVQEAAGFWIADYNKEQTEWVQELISRLNVSEDTNIRITILDTGINNGHALLQPVLSDIDCHTVVPEWRVDDHKGHGTLMAGLCTFGDLQQALESRLPIEIIHRLESAKILPREGDNDPNLYGNITSQGVYLAEIRNPQAKRIYCMAVTSDFQVQRGNPSSWSAVIDALSSGMDDGEKRLFIISAGNIREINQICNYPEHNKNYSVESPAQSWNALTVGAFTQKIRVSDPAFSDYEPLAEPGMLCPYSRTSVSWDKNKWPNKPDVIFEGGNLLKSPDGQITQHEDLAVLTTNFQPLRKQFNIIDGTSSATAQASWMAAQIQVRYPHFWPETIRGLMVQSADWPDSLFRQFRLNKNRKTDIGEMLRLAGYGVPNLGKSIECASNMFTIISQKEIQPYKKEDGSYKTNEMHLYNLPWPKEELQALGAVQVKLKITLSFFIEPGPGEIGWQDRYRYASYGLRFDLNTPYETEREFRNRINAAARDEDYESSESGGDRWLIGIKNRKMGSLHSDTWIGNAADLAACNLIGIYPVIGWWRERFNLKRFNNKARYSLIVSLEVPQTEIDIYTVVKNKIEVTTAITI